MQVTPGEVVVRAVTRHKGGATVHIECQPSTSECEYSLRELLGLHLGCTTLLGVTPCTASGRSRVLGESFISNQMFPS